MPGEGSRDLVLPQVGDKIAGKLRIEREIGRGGVGVVFEASHEILLQPVAVKMLLPEIARRPDAIARFLNEARAAAKLRHEHVAAVLDVGTLEDGAPYLVLEYLEGDDLAALQEREGTLAIESVVDWMLEAMEGVAYAHSLGFVHRDLKPSNLFRARRSDGTWSIKVLDFGLIKALDPHQGVSGALTDVERILGSPAFMSPEQIDDPSAVDARTDQWALGAVLFRLIGGRNPFEAKNLGAMLVEVMDREPTRLERVRPEVPAELARVVHRCLTKDRDKRFADLAELAAALAPFGSADAHASSERIARAKKSSSGTTRTHESASSAQARPSPDRSRSPAHEGTRFESEQSTRRTRRQRTSAVPWVAAAAVAAIGIAGGLQWLTARGHPTSGTPTAPTASAATSASAHTGWPSGPLPPAATPQASSIYRGALDSFRHGQFDAALEGFASALRLDPSLGAAELRLAAYEWTSSRNTLADAREHLQHAEELRATLDARDTAFLDALIPAVRYEPADLEEAARRFSDAVRGWPEDPELLFMLAILQCRLGRYDLGQATYGRAYASDGEFVSALRMRAQALRNLGDVATPQKLLDACLARNPEAIVCRNERVWLNEALGRCEDVEADGRRIAAGDVNSARGYEAMAIAGVALGRPRESVLELLRLAWAHAPAAARDREQTLAQAHLAVLEGRFDEASKLAMHVEETIAADTTAGVHGRARAVLVFAALESGDQRRAAELARDFLAKQTAWSESPDVITGFFLRIRRDAGDLSPAAYRAARDSAEPPNIPFQWADTYLDRPARSWLALFALPVASPADAAEALRAQPEGLAIPTGVSSLPLIDAAIGRTLLLAGRSADSLPHLRAATNTCTALTQPFTHTGAHDTLGRALEATGDTRGACDAYAVVLKRWGSAKPRSITADHARARSNALGCARLDDK